MQPYVEKFISTSPFLSLLSPDIPKKLAHLRETYDIHLVTAWPDRWSEDRIKNLAALGIVYDTIHFITPPPPPPAVLGSGVKQPDKVTSGKLSAVKLLQPVAVVEDKPSTIREISAEGYHLFAPRQWNYVQAAFPPGERHERIELYSNWDELIYFIERLQKGNKH